MTYDTSAPKKATNLTVNSDLLAQAKGLGINLSAVLERSLAAEVEQRQRAAWLTENREAIAAYNEEVEAHGSFGDDVRQF